MNKNNDHGEEEEETTEDEFDGEEEEFDGEEEETTEKEETKEEKGKETVSLSKHLKLKKEKRRLEDELKAKGDDHGLSAEDIEAVKQVRKEQQSAALNKAFDTEYDKVVVLYPELANRREVVRDLSFTDKYFEKSPEEIATEVFEVSKETAEDGEGGDGGDASNIDFENISTKDLEKVLENPAAKKKYYSFLDGKN